MPSLGQDRPRLLGGAVAEAVGKGGLVVIARAVVGLGQGQVAVQVIGGGTSLGRKLMETAQGLGKEVAEPLGLCQIIGVGTVLACHTAGQEPITLPLGQVGKHLRAQALSVEEIRLFGLVSQAPRRGGFEVVAAVAVDEIHPRLGGARAVVDGGARQKGMIGGGEGGRVDPNRCTVHGRISFVLVRTHRCSRSPPTPGGSRS